MVTSEPAEFIRIRSFPTSFSCLLNFCLKVSDADHVKIPCYLDFLGFFKLICKMKIAMRMNEQVIYNLLFSGLANVNFFHRSTHFLMSNRKLL